MTPQPHDVPKPSVPSATIPAPEPGPPAPLDLSNVSALLARVPGAPPAQTPSPQVQALAPPRSQATAEVDVWWGGYSVQAMIPNWCVCAVLVLLLYPVLRLLLPRNYVMLVFYASAGALVLVQLTSWCYRLFSFDYRVTTRHLYLQRGFLYPRTPRIPLETITHVHLRRGPLAQLLGVGEVIVEHGGEPTILRGVFHPQDVVKLLDGLAHSTSQGTTP